MSRAKRAGIRCRGPAAVQPSAAGSHLARDDGEIRPGLGAEAGVSPVGPAGSVILDRGHAALAVRAVADAPASQASQRVRSRAAAVAARLAELSDDELGAELSWIASQPLSEISAFVRCLVGGCGSDGGPDAIPMVVVVGRGSLASVLSYLKRCLREERDMACRFGGARCGEICIAPGVCRKRDDELTEDDRALIALVLADDEGSA